MMPDGSRQYENAAYTRTHRRLIQYGQVLLQQAKGDEPDARDEQTIRKRIWTAAEEQAAWDVLRQVILLPARERIVVNAFYRAREADYWHELEPDKALEILTDMCREINYNVRRWACEAQELPRTVRPHQVLPIRDTAIREISMALDNPTCVAV